MPTVAQLVKEASKLKVKEVPSHVQKFATQHWTPGQLQGRFMNWLQNYKVQVRAGRASPPGGARSSRVGDGRARGGSGVSWLPALRATVNSTSAPAFFQHCSRQRMPSILPACLPAPAVAEPRPRPSRRSPPPLPRLQNIDTGSSKPLVDLVSYGFVFSYALSWPREYAHYKHEQEAKLKGGAAH